MRYLGVVVPPVVRRYPLLTLDPEPTPRPSPTLTDPIHMFRIPPSILPGPHSYSPTPTPTPTSHDE